MTKFNKKVRYMSKKLQREKTSVKYKSQIEQEFKERLRRDYSTPELRENFLRKMWEIANEPSTLTITHLAFKLGYTYDELYHLVEDHYELKKDWIRIKTRIGLNAFDGIEYKKLDGTYAKCSIKKHLKEVKEFLNEEQQELHKLKLEEIKARTKQEQDSDLKPIRDPHDPKKLLAYGIPIGDLDIKTEEQ